MIDPMIVIAQPRMFAAALVAGVTCIGDAFAEPRAWEDLTLKGLLVAAILYLVREITRLRTESQARNTEREVELRKLVQDNTDAMRAMLVAVSKQADYFEQITRKFLDDQLSNNHNNRP